jgi:uncharacterized repeat protein (TIGR03803 family)
MASAVMISLLAFGTAHGQEAPAFTVLHSFTGGADGGLPLAPLIIDESGNLYGTTGTGGDLKASCSGVGTGCGVVFEFDPASGETVLYDFTGQYGGGSGTAGVIRDAKGNLYGTTLSGGPLGEGKVFRLSATGTAITIYAFKGVPDGAGPDAGLIGDAQGNLYGTTYRGGSSTACSNNQGCGTIFKIDSTGKETVLYSFGGPPNDGLGPEASLLRDAQGNLYGTTSAGGGSSPTCLGGACGVVFKLDPSGNETVLHSFNGPDGGSPESNLIMDKEGNLYGTTELGGAFGRGAVYKVSPSGQETTLYSFMDSTDGGEPWGTLVRDTAGNLYGTGSNGGDLNSANGALGAGVIFKVDPFGNETVLYAFTGYADGEYPMGGLVAAKGGNAYYLFGTATTPASTRAQTPEDSGAVLYSDSPFQRVLSLSPDNLANGDTESPDLACV